ncbi:MAG: hypothetical protein ACYC1C_09535 [Chloroflexota bacterium]
MNISESLRSIKEFFFWVMVGADALQVAVDDAAAVARLSRPLGAEGAPRGLPEDIPVCRDHGYRQLPEVAVDETGNVRLLYAPRVEFDEAVDFYRHQLPHHKWQTASVEDRSQQGSRLHTFSINKGDREGSVTLEERTEDIGPLERCVVVVRLEVRAQNLHDRLAA